MVLRDENSVILGRLVIMNLFRFLVPGLRIVFYHLVSSVPRLHYPIKNTVSPELFIRQIEYFVKNFEIISLKEAVKRFNQNFNFDRQLVITTDDGFEENFSQIFPILRRYKLPATLFLIENAIDNKSLMWRHAIFVLIEEFGIKRVEREFDGIICDMNLAKDNRYSSILDFSFRSLPQNLKEGVIDMLWDRLCPSSQSDYLLKEQPYLDSKQIEEMLNSNIEIGCHSKSHPNFELLGNDSIIEESIISSQRLQEKFKTEIFSFSFPFQRSSNATTVLSNVEKKFSVLLGTRETLSSNRKNPLYWERINLETENYKFHLALVPFNNSLRRKRN